MQNILHRTSGYLGASAALLQFALAFSPAGLFADDAIRIATFEIAGQPASFTDLADQTNPFHPMSLVGNSLLDVLPAGRAMTLFCNNEYQILYPVVANAITCPANLVTVFSIETHFVHRGPLVAGNKLGLRYGFNYDLERISAYFDQSVHISYIETDEQLLRMLVSGRLNAALLENNSLNGLLEKIDTKDIAIDKTFYQKLDVQIAISNDKPELINAMQEVFSKPNR